MLDVDRFKTVNDTFGHPEGDRVLAGTAQALLKAFHDVAYVGRLGGDEYAVFIRRDLTQDELETRLRSFYGSIAPLLPNPARVTSSVGAVHFAYPLNVQTVMKQADRLLYAAKTRGRAQWVTAEFSDSAKPTDGSESCK